MDACSPDEAVMIAIRERRSIRRYRADPVARPVIERVLAAACWSPSAHNRQPWRFVVVESAECKQKLAVSMGARLRRDLEADGAPAAVIEADLVRSYSRIVSSPMLVVLCLTMVDMERYPDERRSGNEYLMAVQSVAMAGQNLLLAAHAEGLGACWMCAPLFCPDVVVETLALPDDWQPQALITLGYPDETRSRTRRPAEELTLWR